MCCGCLFLTCAKFFVLFTLHSFATAHYFTEWIQITPTNCILVKPVVPKHARSVTLIKVANIVSYHPQYFAVIAHKTEKHCGFGSADPQKSQITPGVSYHTLATTGLNAITAFSHKIPESQTIQTRKKVEWLIAQTGYLNRNVILIFRFKHLFRAALMWVKETVPRLSSWVSPLGRPESKITLFMAEKSTSHGGL